MAGRPPKPPKILELTGSLAHDKARYAGRMKQAPAAGPIGKPPAHWSLPSSYPVGALARIWNEYIAEFPPGLLDIEHRKLLELLCVATYESRRPGKQQIRWSAEVSKLLAKVGMTPVDRVKIDLRRSPGEGKPAGKLAAFVDRKKAG